ncbi:MAG: Sua5/YciO/YrdC/YwlC family protein [Planctomycetes bacterium]|nr:Sua5/YciO/YrdC/YwlC family protein [Planctomycetota bacterium]
MSNLAFDLYTDDGIQAAASALTAGEVIAIPTDTVPGLAVSATAAAGSKKLADLKGNNHAKPFSWHIAQLKTLQALSPNLPAGIHPWLIEKLQQKCTVLLPSKFFALPSAADWQFDKLGLRWPQNIDFQRLCQNLDSPLLATSINDSTSPPIFGDDLVSWLEQRNVPYALQILDCPPHSPASTIIDVYPHPKLLRGELVDFDEIGLSILVVCSGNTCRSPLAAALLEAEIASSWQVSPEQLRNFGFDIQSAGTFAIDGQSISENSLAVAAENGIDLSSHQAQSLASANEHTWDIVLGMSHNHLNAIPPEIPAALFDHSSGEIADPFGGDIDCYRATYNQLQTAAQQWVKELSAWPQR